MNTSNLLTKFFAIVFVVFIGTKTHAFMSGVDVHKDGGQKLEIRKGVIHMGPKNTNVFAGYGVFENNSDENIEIYKLTSPVFDKTELHTTEISSSGTAKMRHLKSLSIPAKNTIQLDHGAKHVMFLGKRRDLQIGEVIKVVAYDRNEVRYMLHFKVIDPRKSNESINHHMH
ncbi:MAG: hypothetical protein CMD88_05105 [Gammaproteobacteria bacterium]|nr:hypothetical protein [Gammaproteobacteria bacterium]|tara:strand:- start:39786 stop:40298 length:513 start_codon:yes stop_codon:yes gene_type:complete